MMAKGSKFGDLPLLALLNAEPAPEAESVEAQPASFEETVEQADSAQAKMAFLLGLRARGIADVNILRALETIPRVTFAIVISRCGKSRCRSPAGRPCRSPG